MALSLQRLEDAVTKLLREMAVSRKIEMAEVRSRWSSAYHSYAKDALAGAGGRPILTQSLVGSKLVGGTFTTQLSAGIMSYWMGAVWKPDGTFTYVTASASGLEPLLKAEFLKNASQSCTTDAAARRIARALHSYTTKLVVVTATNIQSGVTAPVLVV